MIPILVPVALGLAVVSLLFGTDDEATAKTAKPLTAADDTKPKPKSFHRKPKEDDEAMSNRNRAALVAAENKRIQDQHDADAKKAADDKAKADADAAILADAKEKQNDADAKKKKTETKVETPIADA